MNWFCERYGVVIEPSTLITGPIITNEAREMIQKHLYSYNTWILHGLMFGVESVKSLLLALACVDRFITVEDAVRLSSLETEFQVSKKILMLCLGQLIYQNIELFFGYCDNMIICPCFKIIAALI